MTDSNRAGWPSELSVTLTGAVDAIGKLLQNPSILIFDNQSTASVAISVNDPSGSTVWKTFTPGEALVLDFKTNKGVADTFSASIGDTFYGTGTVATGNFSISYIYAQPL